MNTQETLDSFFFKKNYEIKEAMAKTKREKHAHAWRTRQVCKESY